jgi:hypothetical protein
LSIHASIKHERVRSKFTKSPKTGDLGFTMTVARKGGVEVNGDLIPSQQGWASAAEHFGGHLAVPRRDDERKRQQQAQAAPDTAASVTR